MRRIGIVLLTMFALAMAFAIGGQEANAQTYVYYEGWHPIPEAFGGGFCYEEGPHYHAYAPVDLDFYVVYDGYYHFVGDPWFYGYSGSLHWYYDPHPIWVGGYSDVCYIAGPHRHWYQPAPRYGMYFHHSHGYYYASETWPRHVHYNPVRRIALADRFPRQYSHYQRMAPRTPPPVSRPPAARPGPRYAGVNSAVRPGSAARPEPTGRPAVPAARPGQHQPSSPASPQAPRYGNGSRPQPSRPDATAPRYANPGQASPQAPRYGNGSRPQPSRPDATAPRYANPGTAAPSKPMVDGKSAVPPADRSTNPVRGASPTQAPSKASMGVTPPTSRPAASTSRQGTPSAPTYNSHSNYYRTNFETSRTSQPHFAPRASETRSTFRSPSSSYSRPSARPTSGGGGFRRSGGNRR